MALWIPATLFAALMQALRFALQRHLKLTALSTAGATWARFVFAAPLALAVALGWAALSGQALPAPGAAFWGWIVPGALAQVLATMCVVALFARRAFPVGVTLRKRAIG